MGNASWLRLAGISLLLALVAGGCRPLYLPLVPELAHPEPRPRLEAELLEEQGRPVLNVRMIAVPEEGWLAVQWFGPDNREAASGSVWVDPASAGTAFIMPLPADVPVRSGEWRVLLSIHSTVLRQVSLLLGSN